VYRAGARYRARIAAIPVSGPAAGFSSGHRRRCYY
jgi:hypothetical protein